MSPPQRDLVATMAVTIFIGLVRELGDKPLAQGSGKSTLARQSVSIAMEILQAANDAVLP